MAPGCPSDAARPIAACCVVLLCLAAGEAARADTSSDTANAHHATPPVRAVHGPPAAASRPATSPPQPLKLRLTQAQLDALIARFDADRGATDVDSLDGVTVTAPRQAVPMRDDTTDIWGGVAAPVWALLHPSEAWRILLPVPPK